jgi:transaldolase
MQFAASYLQQTSQVAGQIDAAKVEAIAQILRETRDLGGRLFIVGSGGGAGHASHATCDFRKLGGFEAYCPTDNVSLLTARINDDGWDSSLVSYLKSSRLNQNDCLFVFSVGGGSEEKNISTNLVNAVKYAKECRASVVGVLGRDGGYTAKVADAFVIVPTIDDSAVTAHTESFQAVIWHLLVSHPEIQRNPTKWESVRNSILLPSGANPEESLQISPQARALNVKIFADGADKAGMLQMNMHPMIAGFTTNPTLMRKAGVEDYRRFAQDILTVIKDKPISFEVFTDDLDAMETQAREIASWGRNVVVKIPVTNTKGDSTVKVISDLSRAGVRVNVTAMMTPAQVQAVVPALQGGPPAFVSVFAGRIADSGRDPVPIMKEIVEFLKASPNIQLIWASPREVLNVVQANAIGCHIITATNDLIKKISLFGKDLDQFSLETVKMFYDDARTAGYSLEITRPAAVMAPVP